MDFKTEFGIVPLNQLKVVGEAGDEGSSTVPMILWIGGIAIVSVAIYQLLEIQKERERERENSPRFIYRE